MGEARTFLANQFDESATGNSDRNSKACKRVDVFRKPL